MYRSFLVLISCFIFSFINFALHCAPCASQLHQALESIAVSGHANASNIVAGLKFKLFLSHFKLELLWI